MKTLEDLVKFSEKVKAVGEEKIKDRDNVGSYTFIKVIIEDGEITAAFADDYDCDDTEYWEEVTLKELNMSIEEVRKREAEKRRKKAELITQSKELTTLKKEQEEYLEYIRLKGKFKGQQSYKDADKFIKEMKEKGETKLKTIAGIKYKYSASLRFAKTIVDEYWN